MAVVESTPGFDDAKKSVEEMDKWVYHISSKHGKQDENNQLNWIGSVQKSKEVYQVQRQTPDNNLRTQQPKHCDPNNHAGPNTKHIIGLHFKNSDRNNDMFLLYIHTYILKLCTQTLKIFNNFKVSEILYIDTYINRHIHICMPTYIFTHS